MRFLFSCHRCLSRKWLPLPVIFSGLRDTSLKLAEKLDKLGNILGKIIVLHSKDNTITVGK